MAEKMIAWITLIAVVTILAVGYAGSMDDLWEQSFNGARRQCIYDNGHPSDERDANGRMIAVRCVSTP